MNRKQLAKLMAQVGAIAKFYEIAAGHDVFCNCATCAPVNAVTIVGFVISALG